MLTPGKLMGLRRLADVRGRFKMLAVDQRPPIENLVRDARNGSAAAFEDVVAVKRALITELGQAASALLVDPQYIFPAVIPDLHHGRGLLVTLEDDSFDETPGGRLSRPIPDWSVTKIRSSGGDAVKVLAWFRPDASPEVIDHQKQFVATVGDDCRRHDIPFIFELLLYPLPGETGHTTDYVEQPGKRSDHVVESVETFATEQFGVDLFKLESPVAPEQLSSPGSASVQAAFDQMSAAAARPWVLLSAGAGPETFRTALAHAYQAGASGYLAGRAIWWDAASSGFPEMADVRRGLQTSALTYMEDLNTMTDDFAAPWFEHEVFGVEGPQPPRAGAEFRSGYLSDWS